MSKKSAKKAAVKKAVVVTKEKKLVSFHKTAKSLVIVMKVDGKTVYACLARLEAREMLIEPLPNKALVRDLMTEIAPSDEELK